jgi:hypothetical protein
VRRHEILIAVVAALLVERLEVSGAEIDAWIGVPDLRCEPTPQEAR